MIKVGLNIGNSKLSCAVFEVKESHKYKLLSCESYPSQIIKKNLITNFDQLLHEIKNLINESEKKSQTKINSINLNIPTLSSISKYYDSKIEIANNEISELDIKKAINKSDYFAVKEDYYELYNNIYAYILDNNLLINSPVGNYGQNLKLLFYKLLIPNKVIKSYKNIINKLNIKIDNFVPSPLSTALAVLSEDEKSIGSICIDLGHSNTSISIFENGNFIYGDSVLVGSNNITNDIARGVSTTMDSAERLKTLYSSLITAPSDEYEIIEVPIISGETDKLVQVNRLKINSIVKPRVEETLEMIWQKLKQNNLHKKQIKNVVLTGGGSQLEGITQYAELIFSSNVRIGYPKEDLVFNESMKNSSFADVIGCSLFDPDIYLDKIIEKQGKKQKKQGFRSFFNWLDQYI
tara:strand:+ start:4386 stop:5606 length:1221 start_codon:yes stop_codon:yes gene_type:complete